ncbi:ABC transporter substrate-binding protein [Lederbergia panacisoli]|uniref:ABC transporter substrate-binding protein n=1 Tax=Lederbergia panacisoli TaxID=1255251 RepID=UPI00214AD8FB|nr:ABC transporter substrate-binding protein [Lederbergia panacisoli]MCR2820076.1 ABC transporter substrate-binding protein [Lederbergia panacisoli]
MVKKRFLMIIAMVFVMGLALIGCSNSDDANTGTNKPKTGNNSGPNEEGGEGVEGGKVTFAFYAAPGGVFNPLLLSETNEQYIVEFVYESLIELDEELAWKPLLAKSWEFEDDNKTLVFTLNENVKWHDGEPFTANDVKYTYEVVAHPEYTGVRQDYAGDLVGFEEFNSGKADELSGVEVVNDYTVKLHFKEQNALALFRGSIDIIPEHVFSKYDVKDLKTAPEVINFNDIIGTGPFKASESVTNESYSLVRNDDYFKGSPKLDGVVWKVVNEDLASGLLENGEVDVLLSVAPQDYELVESIPGIKMHEAPALSYNWLGFKLNQRPKEDVEKGVIDPEHFIPNKKVQDKKLRQAIAYAINREGIVNGLLGGHGTVINGHMAPSSWAYNEEGVNTYPFDPEKAKSILDEAGYKDANNDGFREDPDGKELVLKLDYTTGAREKAVPIIVQQLEEIGLKIDLQMPMDLGSLISMLEKDEDTDIFVAGWEPNTEDPDPKSTYWDTKSIWNITRWNDKHQQELLDKGVKTPEAFDQEYRVGIYNEWNAYVMEELPMLSLYANNSIRAWNDKIQNVKPEQLKIFRDIHEWYIQN